MMPSLEARRTVPILVFISIVCSFLLVVGSHVPAAAQDTDTPPPAPQVRPPEPPDTSSEGSSMMAPPSSEGPQQPAPATDVRPLTPREQDGWIKVRDDAYRMPNKTTETGLVFEGFRHRTFALSGRSFLLSPRTKCFNLQGKPIVPNELKIGDTVDITYLSGGTTAERYAFSPQDKVISTLRVVPKRK